MPAALRLEFRGESGETGREEEGENVCGCCGCEGDQQREGTTHASVVMSCLPPYMTGIVLEEFKVLCTSLAVVNHVFLQHVK